MAERKKERCGRTEPHEPHEWLLAPYYVSRWCDGVSEDIGPSGVSAQPGPDGSSDKARTE